MVYVNHALNRLRATLGLAPLGVGHNCPACRELRLSRLIGERTRRHNLPTKFSRQAGTNAMHTDIAAAEDVIDPHAAPLAILGPGGNYTVEIKP
jgi:hypothetical protein